MQRFSELHSTDFRSIGMTKDELDEREKQFSHLRCIVLLVLSKMMKKLADNTCAKRFARNRRYL